MIPNHDQIRRILGAFTTPVPGAMDTPAGRISGAMQFLPQTPEGYQSFQRMTRAATPDPDFRPIGGVVAGMMGVPGPAGVAAYGPMKEMFARAAGQAHAQSEATDAGTHWNMGPHGLPPQTVGPPPQDFLRQTALLAGGPMAMAGQAAASTVNSSVGKRADQMGNNDGVVQSWEVQQLQKHAELKKKEADRAKLLAEQEQLREELRSGKPRQVDQPGLRDYGAGLLGQLIASALGDDGSFIRSYAPALQQERERERLRANEEFDRDRQRLAALLGFADQDLAQFDQQQRDRKAELSEERRIQIGLEDTRYNRNRQEGLDKIAADDRRIRNYIGFMALDEKMQDNLRMAPTKEARIQILEGQNRVNAGLLAMPGYDGPPLKILTPEEINAVADRMTREASQLQAREDAQALGRTVLSMGFNLETLADPETRKLVAGILRDTYTRAGMDPGNLDVLLKSLGTWAEKAGAAAGSLMGAKIGAANRSNTGRGRGGGSGGASASGGFDPKDKNPRTTQAGTPYSNGVSDAALNSTIIRLTTELKTELARLQQMSQSLESDPALEAAIRARIDEIDRNRNSALVELDWRITNGNRKPAAAPAGAQAPASGPAPTAVTTTMGIFGLSGSGKPGTPAPAQPARDPKTPPGTY